MSDLCAWLQLNLEMFFLVAYLIIKFSSLFSISLIFFFSEKGLMQPRLTSNVLYYRMPLSF